MDKKMKGIADPFTLGLIIALLGSAAAVNINSGDSNQTVAQETTNTDGYKPIIATYDETGD